MTKQSSTSTLTLPYAQKKNSDNTPFVIWNLIFEGLLSAFVKNIDRYFPGQLLSTVATGGTDRISYQYALFTSYAFLLAGLAIVAFLFKKRDVAN